LLHEPTTNAFQKTILLNFNFFIMTQKLIIPCLLISSVILYSCGTGKKLEAANTQIQELQGANSDLTSKQKALQDQAANLAAANKSLTQEYSQYKAGCEATTQKLQAKEAAEKEDEKTLLEVEKKIEAALENFAGKGVEVYEKNDAVYVNMDEKLLYKSGSAVLGEEGKKALAALSSALNDYPDLGVVVVGHTDDQKFKSTNTDNLSLSTERANGVVRVLRDNQVNPIRLTSAGKGKFDPVADNTTAEGRAKNRRTEIILKPNLDKLLESAEKK
jgi:chemotaxis protein MotB